MSKQDMLKIQNNVLMVNIHCDGCKQKVKKTLQKVEGVYKVSIDVDQGKVTVSGNVDAATLINKLEKSGKHAELWGGQKNQMNNQFKDMQIDNSKGKKDDKSQKGGGKDNQQKGGQQPFNPQMMMQQKGGGQPFHPQMMMPQNGSQQPSPQQMMMMMQQMKDMKEGKGPQNGGQQPSPQQMMMMQQMKDNNKGPVKDQKSAKFNMHEDESDDYDDDDDDFDSEFDDEEDYDDKDDDDHAPLDKKMQAKMMDNDHGKIKGGGGGGGGKGKHEPSKEMNSHGHKDSKSGGKKGGGGMAGMLKQLKGIGGKKDVKEGGKGGKNKKGVNSNEGGKNGGGKPGKGKGEKNKDFGGKGGESMGKNEFGGKMDGGFMVNKMPHGLQDMNMNKKGGGNMGPMGGQMGQMKNMHPQPQGPMGNYPMEQMRNFPPVQGFPAGGGGEMNHGGGYYPGMGQGPPQVNPYNQQQYMAQMMMNQQQRGYGGPDMYPPMYAQPHPALMYGSPMAPPRENYSHMFNDENANSCSVM